MRRLPAARRRARGQAAEVIDLGSGAHVGLRKEEEEEELRVLPRALAEALWAPTTITPFTPPGPRCLRHRGGRSRPASAEVKAKELIQLTEGDAEVIVVVDAQGWHDAIVLAVAVELQKVSPWEVP